MPKSSNESSRQMLEYIKKVAAAGRGGDTKLAYLSSSARQLLKDLGGAGTKNPKTKLPEYRRRRFLEEGEGMEPSAGAPPAAPAFQPPPVMPEPPPVMPEPPAAMTPIASEPPQAPPMDPRDFRLAQEPRPMFSGMLPPAAPTPPVEAAPPPAAPEPAARPAVQSPFDDDMTPAQRRAAARRGEDLLRPPQTTPGRDMPSPPVDAPPPPAAVQPPPPPPPPPAVVEPPPPPPPPPAQPPVAQPPVTQPPVAQPPVAQPPVAQPPIAPPAQPVPPPAPPPPPPVAQPPAAPPAPPPPPPGLVESPIQKQPTPPQTGQPPGTGIFFPQPPSSPPPPPPTPPAPPSPGKVGQYMPPSEDVSPIMPQPVLGDGIRIPGTGKGPSGAPEKLLRDKLGMPRVSVPGDGSVRTGDFIDRNLNGVDDRDEGGTSPKKKTPQGSIPGRFLDDNTDIGRLLKRVGGGRSVSRGPSTKGGLKRGAPKPPVDQIPEPPGGKIPDPPVGLFPEPPGGDQPTIPVQPPPNIPVRGPESQIPVRPLPGPLPTPIGAGTPTPYFNPNAGGLTPGTVPVSQMPESLKTSQVPLDAIARNPNLSPTILGGQENLGYYRDRLGNLIMAPGAVRPPGFALGGEVTDEEEDYGEQDAASARAMLDRLSSEAPEFRAIPTKRRARRQEAERGSAKGMAMELEQMSKPQGPRTKRQAEELRQKMELLRDTLGMPTLTRAGLAREGELLAQRFAEGGEAEKEKLVLPPDRSKGFREEGMEFNPNMIPSAQVRTYLNTLFGQTRPITERDFTKEELRLALEAMKKAKESGRESTVDYRDYGIPLTPFADVHPFEEASIRNTLGTWNYKTEDGTLRGRDRYDFDRDLGGRSSAEYAKMSLPKKLGVLALDSVNFLPLLKDMYNVVRLKPMTGEGMAYGPLTLPHRIGAAFMPPEGREVNIDFGKQAAKELEAVAPKKKKGR